MIIEKNLKYFTTPQPAEIEKKSQVWHSSGITIAIDMYNFRHTQFLDQKHILNISEFQQQYFANLHYKQEKFVG